VQSPRPVSDVSGPGCQRCTRSGPAVVERHTAHPYSNGLTSEGSERAPWHLLVSPVLLGEGEHLLSGIDLPALGFRVAEQVATEAALHVVLARGG